MHMNSFSLSLFIYLSISLSLYLSLSLSLSLSVPLFLSYILYIYLSLWSLLSKEDKEKKIVSNLLNKLWKSTPQYACAKLQCPSNPYFFQSYFFPLKKKVRIVGWKLRKGRNMTMFVRRGIENARRIHFCSKLFATIFFVSFVCKQDFCNELCEIIILWIFSTWRLFKERQYYLSVEKQERYLLDFLLHWLLTSNFFTY